MSLETGETTVKIEPIVRQTEAEIGGEIASRIIELANAKGSAPFLLGCPSGRTGMPVYRSLARAAASGVDLSTIVVVMMDEYLLGDSERQVRPVDPSRSYSCLGFAQREIVAPMASGAARAGVGSPREIWVAQASDPGEYDSRIAAAGGIDFFILASGASDGHVAFNQPGTDRDAPTHIVRLGEATRRDNMETFPEFRTLDMVPRFGLSVGTGTIAGLSSEVAMIVTGEAKKHAFERIASARTYEPDWPSTIVTECRNPSLYADVMAAGRG